MRRFICVLKAPSQFLLRSLSLVKVAWKLRMHDTGDPVHNEHLAAGELLCLVKRGNRVLYIPVALQKRHSGGVLSAQQTNDSQVQRLLYRCQLGVKFPETRAEKFRALVRQVRIGKLSHQDEQQLRFFWRGDAVYRLQVLQIRIAPRGIVPVTTPQIDNSHADNQQNTHHYADSHESTGFHRVEGA